MLNPLRLNYIEAAHHALTLALKLDRIADAKATKEDFDLVQTVAEDLDNLLKGLRPEPHFPLFATPQGLRIAIAVSRKQAPNAGADPLAPIARMLQEVRAQKPRAQLSQDTRNRARQLSNFFREAHDYAQGLVASMPGRTAAGAPRAAVGLLP